MDGCDPFRLLKENLGVRLADTLSNVALDEKNPNKTGKNANFWSNCYEKADKMRLQIENEYLKKAKSK
jgi:hypothetical protein